MRTGVSRRSPCSWPPHPARRGGKSVECSNWERGRHDLRTPGVGRRIPNPIAPTQSRPELSGLGAMPVHQAFRSREGVGTFDFLSCYRYIADIGQKPSEWGPTPCRLSTSARGGGSYDVSACDRSGPRADTFGLGRLAGSEQVPQQRESRFLPPTIAEQVQQHRESRYRPATAPA
jgi:hypothetical protein